MHLIEFLLNTLNPLNRRLQTVLKTIVSCGLFRPCPLEKTNVFFSQSVWIFHSLNFLRIFTCEDITENIMLVTCISFLELELREITSRNNGILGCRNDLKIIKVLTIGSALTILLLRYILSRVSFPFTVKLFNGKHLPFRYLFIIWEGEKNTLMNLI